MSNVKGHIPVLGPEGGHLCRTFGSVSVRGGQAQQPQAVLSKSSLGTDPEVSSLPCLRVTLLSPVLVSPC